MAKRRRRSRARRAVRYAGKAAMGGIRGAALQAATGAVANLGASAVASRVGFVGSTWWAPPLGMAVLGVLMKKRPRLRGLGDAMLGAAGYAGAQNFQLSRSVAASAGEAGALYAPGNMYDTGLLVGGSYGALNDQQNPTSSFYVPEGTAAGDISSAMML